MFDSRPTVAWPPTTIAWQFSEFFQKIFELLKTSKKRCSTVGQQSRDLRPLSRDRSATFFQNFSEFLETSKNGVWQSANSRVTSDHCRVTVQWLFFKIFPNCLKRRKTLFHSHLTVPWPPTTITWPFGDFFSNFSDLLGTSKKTLFDSRPTVAWPPTTVAWPFGDFFQKSPDFLKMLKKRCLTVGQRSFDLRPLSRDRSATFFKIFPNCLKRRKNIVWQSADSRVTSDHCRVTVWRLFSKNFWIARNVKKTLFDSRPTVAWPLTTVAWPFSDFFQKFSELLETSKNVVWQSANSRVIYDHCRVTVQRLFFEIFPNCLKRQKTLFHSHLTVPWPPTFIAWPFGDFFSIFPICLKRRKKRCLTIGQRSRDLRPLSRDRSATFFKNFPICLKRWKNVVCQSANDRVTSDHCRVTVQRLFSKIFWTVWNVKKTLFDSRPTVAWPPTTVAWPFSDFFQNFSELLKT